MEKKMNFEYTDIKIPDNHFGISPSGISKFFDNPSNWYRDNFTDETTFTGSTATELGSILHAIAEAVAKGDTTDTLEIEAYIDSIDNPDVDKTVIRSLYSTMASVLINEYVLRNKPDIVEKSLSMDLGNNITLKGTLDGYYNNGVVLDYKSASAKPKTDAIPWHYKVQLMAYTKLMRSKGNYVDRLRIVYIVRPTKTLPARVFVVNHMITDQDEKDFEDVLEIMKRTITLTKEQPELIPVLYKSMNLKEK